MCNENYLFSVTLIKRSEGPAKCFWEFPEVFYPLGRLLVLGQTQAPRLKYRATAMKRLFSCSTVEIIGHGGGPLVLLATFEHVGWFRPDSFCPHDISGVAGTRSCDLSG